MGVIRVTPVENMRIRLREVNKAVLVTLVIILRVT